MADFTIENIYELNDYNYYDLYDGVGIEAANFSWWCLGHNFDVVACILSMSKLSWEKGFDAGLVIADFSNSQDSNPSTNTV